MAAKQKIIWTKFYWQDWLSDAGLRRSGLAARGLWMDMLCIAAQHDPIGLVAINGEGLSVDDIARMAGVDPREAATLIGELERNDVFARDRKGIIYSRRMVRDAKKAATNRKNGKDGGNPSLNKDKGNSSWVNPPVKPPDKPQELRAKSYEPAQRSRSDLDEIENRLRSAAHVENDPAPGLMDLSPVLGLLDAGYSLEEDVLPIVRARTKPSSKPRTWGFFTEAIREARARRLAIGATPAPAAREITAGDWDEAVDRFKRTAVWPGYIKGKSSGPEPGYDGCKAPREVLEKYGYLKLQAAE